MHRLQSLSLCLFSLVQYLDLLPGGVTEVYIVEADLGERGWTTCPTSRTNQRIRKSRRLSECVDLSLDAGWPLSLTTAAVDIRHSVNYLGHQE